MGDEGTTEQGGPEAAKLGLAYYKRFGGVWELASPISRNLDVVYTSEVGEQFATALKKLRETIDRFHRGDAPRDGWD